jgi:uncharacterized membrane protein YtjA (UPF0391 family)
MHNVPPLTEVPTLSGDEDLTEDQLAELAPGREATIWVSRITFVVGAVFLILALLAWLFRQHHYRLVLAFLIVALFASILHSYVVENGSEV